MHPRDIPAELKMGYRIDTYGGNWVSILATWMPILRLKNIPSATQIKTKIDPKLIGRTHPLSPVASIDDVKAKMEGYRFGLFSRLQTYVNKIKNDLPAYVVNQIRRLDNELCWMDHLFEPRYLERIKLQQPCGMTYLCPYCRSRYCCKPLYRAMARGIDRQIKKEEAFIARGSARRVPLTRLVRMAIKVKFRSDHVTCGQVKRFASAALSRITKRVQRVYGRCPPRVRGGIITANVTFNTGSDGYTWCVYFRGLVIQDRDLKNAENNLRKELIKSIGPGTGRLRFTHHDARAVASDDMNKRTKSKINTGVFIIREVAWATKFFDVSAAPPSKIISMMRGRRWLRLQRRFGVCHNTSGKSMALARAWKQYEIDRPQGVTDDKDSAGDSAGDGAVRIHGGQQGGPEGSLPGAEEPPGQPR